MKGNLLLGAVALAPSLFGVVVGASVPISPQTKAFPYPEPPKATTHPKPPKAITDPKPPKAITDPPPKAFTYPPAPKAITDPEPIKVATLVDSFLPKFKCDPGCAGQGKAHCQHGRDACGCCKDDFSPTPSTPVITAIDRRTFAPGPGSASLGQLTTPEPSFVAGPGPNPNNGGPKPSNKPKGGSNPNNKPPTTVNVNERAEANDPTKDAEESNAEVLRQIFDNIAPPRERSISDDPKQDNDPGNGDLLASIFDTETPPGKRSEAKGPKKDDLNQCDPKKNPEQCNAELLASIFDTMTPPAKRSQAKRPKKDDPKQCDPNKDPEQCNAKLLAGIFDTETPPGKRTEAKGPKNDDPNQCDPKKDPERCNAELLASIWDTSVPPAKRDAPMDTFLEPKSIVDAEDLPKLYERLGGGPSHIQDVVLCNIGCLDRCPPGVTPSATRTKCPRDAAQMTTAAPQSMPPLPAEVSSRMSEVWGDKSVNPALKSKVSSMLSDFWAEGHPRYTGMPKHTPTKRAEPKPTFPHHHTITKIPAIPIETAKPPHFGRPQTARGLPYNPEPSTTEHSRHWFTDGGHGPKETTLKTVARAVDAAATCNPAWWGVLPEGASFTPCASATPTTDTVLNSGFVPPSITSSLTGRGATSTAKGSGSNSGIVPPYLTESLSAWRSSTSCTDTASNLETMPGWTTSTMMKSTHTACGPGPSHATSLI